MQTRLILLDFDGTLADTRRANTLAYVAALHEAGYRLTPEAYETRYFGMRCEEFLTDFGIADPVERERLRLRKIALYPAFFDTVRLNVPLWEFCRQFRSGGGRVWIVSTGSRANIDNATRYLGIGCAPARDEDGIAAGTPEEEVGKAPHGSTTGHHPVAGEAPCGTATDSGVYGTNRTHSEIGSGEPVRTRQGTVRFENGCVDGIISGADVTHAKPAPDCFLEAMRREGCIPGETLIFEDSAIGLEAARRSGAAYIKVAF